MGNACGYQSSLQKLEIKFEDMPEENPTQLKCLSSVPRLGSDLNSKNYYGKTIENTDLERNRKQSDIDENIFVDHTNEDEENDIVKSYKFNSPVVRIRVNRFIQDIELEVKSIIKTIQLEEMSKQKYRSITAGLDQKSFRPTTQTQTTSIVKNKIRSSDQIQLRQTSQIVQKGILKNCSQQRQDSLPINFNLQQKSSLFKRVHFRGFELVQ